MDRPPELHMNSDRLQQLAQGGEDLIDKENKPTTELFFIDEFCHVHNASFISRLADGSINEVFTEMPLTDVLWDAETLHGLDWQDALVQHEAQFGECLVVDNKGKFDLLTNGLPSHGNDRFLPKFDRDGGLQHEAVWDEEMSSDIGTHESVVLTPVSTSGLLKQCNNAEDQVFGDFPSKVVVWDEELFHDLDSHDGLLQQLALGGQCGNGEKMICIPLLPGNRWSEPFSDFESVKLDMTTEIDSLEAILTNVDHVTHELGATGCRVTACEFSETVVLEIRQETIDACMVLTEMPCQEDDTQLVEQVVSGVAAVSNGPAHVLFDEISPNGMATTHLEQAVFMIPGVSGADVAEVLVEIFGQVVWDEMPATIGAHHGLLQHLTHSGDYFGEEKKVESVDPVTSQGASHVMFLAMPFMDVVWDDDLLGGHEYQEQVESKTAAMSRICANLDKHKMDGLSKLQVQELQVYLDNSEVF